MGVIPGSSRSENVEKWLEIRRRGITATEIARLMTGGLTDSQFRLEKRGGKSFGGNIFTRWGNMREEKILDFLRDRTGLEIVSNDLIWCRDDKPRYLATPDGVGDSFCCEVKTTGTEWWVLENVSRAEREDFRLCGVEQYFLQAQWQMFVLEKKENIFGWEYRKVRDGVRLVTLEGRFSAYRDGVELDSIEDIFEPGGTFWTTVRVDYDLQDLMDDYARRVLILFDNPETAPNIPDNLWELRALQDELARKLKEVKEQIAGIVEDALKPGESFIYPQGTITRSVRRGAVRLDRARLKADHPRAFKKYVEGYETVGDPVVVNRVTLAKELGY